MGRSRWGSVRKLPSGRFQARYCVDLVWHSAPTTFRTKREADAYLASVRSERTIDGYRVLAIAVLAILVSCTTAQDTPGMATNRLMSATPATIVSPATVELWFKGELAVIRGGYYVVLDASGSELIALNSDANIEVPPHSFLPTDTLVPILDYGLTGPGPDRINLPELLPGQYRLCTLNSKPRACVELTIV